MLRRACTCIRVCVHGAVSRCTHKHKRTHAHTHVRPHMHTSADQDWERTHVYTVTRHTQRTHQKAHTHMWCALCACAPSLYVPPACPPTPPTCPPTPPGCACTYTHTHMRASQEMLPGEAQPRIVRLQCLWEEQPSIGQPRMLARCTRMYRPEVRARGRMRVDTWTRTHTHSHGCARAHTHTLTWVCTHIPHAHARTHTSMHAHTQALCMRASKHTRVCERCAAVHGRAVQRCEGVGGCGRLGALLRHASAPT